MRSAVRQMHARDVTEVEIREALLVGEAIEEDPDESPAPRQPILATVSGRTVHVVAAHPAPDTIVMITVYEPDPTRWKPGFRERRRR